MFEYINGITQAPNPTGLDSLKGIMALILNVVMGVGFSLSIISLAYAGLTYVTSSGDPKNTAKAWSGFLWGAISGIVTLAAFAIKKAVLTSIGVDSNLVNNDLPF